MEESKQEADKPSKLRENLVSRWPTLAGRIEAGKGMTRIKALQQLVRHGREVNWKDVEKDLTKRERKDEWIQEQLEEHCGIKRLTD